MPVTVKVNGTTNSLAHKGAGHSSPATMPDVCKTPSPGGPVPLPYPNVTQSSSLAKGSSTVKADGGSMIAIKGSEYAMSSGDEPGTAGGVKSSTFKKESSWILYSFDVKIEGKNACRLTDKKFQNHENTVDLAGDLGPTVAVATHDFKCAVKECDNMALSDDQKNAVKNAENPCAKLGTIKHECVSQKMDGKKGVQNEPSYDVGRNPPERLRRSPPNGRAFCPNFFSAFASVTRNCAAEGVKYATGRMRRPDCVVGRDQPRKVLDAKFPCNKTVEDGKPMRGATFPSADLPGDDFWRPGQKKAYQKIAGKKGHVEAVSPHDVKASKPPIEC